MSLNARAFKGQASLPRLLHRPQTLSSILQPKEKSIQRGLASKPPPTSSNGTFDYDADLKQMKLDRSIEDKIEQNLILDVLEASATKRDAKIYLNRFGPQRPRKQPDIVPQTMKGTAGINLGDFYLPVRTAIDKSPVLAASTEDRPSDWDGEILHVALVKIRALQSIDDETLRGVVHTVSQLSRLGMQSVIVVDCGGDSQARKEAAHQADRIVEAIDGLKGEGSRRLDGAISISPNNKEQVGGRLYVSHRHLMLSPLRRGIIPVIAPLGFDISTGIFEAVGADEVVLALTREFAGISTAPRWEEDADDVADRIKLLQKEISLDRIIILDPLGGIPSKDRYPGSHLIINLEQEYDGLQRQLLDSGNGSQHHVDNLQLIKSTLALLPPSSSAFVTTPQAVAQSAQAEQRPQQSTGPSVGTRRQRNPLIHNLLTDKPAVSPSLPVNRAPPLQQQFPLTANIKNVSTILKRGTSVTFIPTLSPTGWTLPSPTTSSPSPLGLLNPQIDLQRLTHLINDSFGRTLDIKAYDLRTRDTLAGVIIAGEYEGAAIFTWEQPPPAYSTPSAPLRPWVPYLDKFAVLRRSQGSPTADILWNAMTKDAFPNGFCWRSRTKNPVNKWYFERCRGHWQLPGGVWTMFWNQKGVFEEADQRSWRGFLGVCSSVQPSWVDRTGPKALD